MKAHDHLIMFYSNLEDKHRILFTYLKAGLESGVAAIYVASQESPDEIRNGIRGFGIDADESERVFAVSGAGQVRMLAVRLLPIVYRSPRSKYMRESLLALSGGISSKPYSLLYSSTLSFSASNTMTLHPTSSANRWAVSRTQSIMILPTPSPLNLESLAMWPRRRLGTSRKGFCSLRSFGRSFFRRDAIASVTKPTGVPLNLKTYVTPRFSLYYFNVSFGF